MRTWLKASGVTVLLIAASAIPAIAADDVLKVCLDEDLPPLSSRRQGASDRGFDVALAEAVAGRLGRSLKIQWFESKLDEDSSPALEANALVSKVLPAMIAGAACRSACSRQVSPISIRH
jgi:ABC-type amino acid transport substrate-binding protein